MDEVSLLMRAQAEREAQREAELKARAAKKAAEEGKQAAEPGAEFEDERLCNICYFMDKDIKIEPCGHETCSKCIQVHTQNR